MKKFLSLPLILFFSFQLKAQNLVSDTLYKKGVLQNKNFEVTFPFENSRDWIILTVDINGIPKRFLFDTGASISVLDSNTIGDLSLKEIGTLAISDVNRKKAVQKVCEIQNMTIGGMLIKDAPICITNFPEFLSCEGIQGILGINIINKFNWIISNESMTLTITDKRIEKNINEKEFYYYQSHNNHLVNISIDNNQFWDCCIDFGFNGTLSIHELRYDKSIKDKINSGAVQSAIKSKYGLFGKSAVDTSFYVNAYNIKIREFLEDSIVLTLENDSSSLILIGAEFFSRFNVKIDNTNQRYILCPFKKKEPEKERKSIGLEWENGKIIVQYIYLCSSAFFEGICINDEISLVNNKSAADFNNNCEFSQWIKGQEALTIVLKDNAKTFYIKSETIKYIKECAALKK